MGRPIVWFAPDLDHYESTRGLYEPLAVTSAGRIERTWSDVIERLEQLQRGSSAWRAAEADTRAFARRFHSHPEGDAASRVLAEIRRLRLRDKELVPTGVSFSRVFTDAR
ncbi:CDP-glycerol glycerophosphotransferase family protein [Leucobacter coleopterorum]|uniref:CDP-glycerol glycerophosphotransferase family protein n=1 Tax=Leucobacter coleopterorum TaxID=2714933 RepID=UPI00244E1EB3|nr:CDP-glycerol glycerophosphotransferase family protein [Leucobacter coleopterorum]